MKHYFLFTYFVSNKQNGVLKKAPFEILSTTEGLKSTCLVLKRLFWPPCQLIRFDVILNFDGNILWFNFTQFSTIFFFKFQATIQGHHKFFISKLEFPISGKANPSACSKAIQHTWIGAEWVFKTPLQVFYCELYIPALRWHWRKMDVAILLKILLMAFTNRFFCGTTPYPSWHWWFLKEFQPFLVPYLSIRLLLLLINWKVLASPLSANLGSWKDLQNISMLLK